MDSKLGKTRRTHSWHLPGGVFALAICGVAVWAGWPDHGVKPTSTSSQRSRENGRPVADQVTPSPHQARETQRDPALRSVSISGRILWPNGTPASNVKVDSDTQPVKQTATQSDGTFSVLLADRSITSSDGSMTVRLYVLAPCWIDHPHIVDVALTDSGGGAFRAPDIELPDRIDVQVAVALDDYIVEQLRADGYGRLVCVASDAAIPVLPPQLGMQSFELRTGTTKAVLRVTHASVVNLSLSARAEETTNLRQVGLAGGRTLPLALQKTNKVNFAFGGNGVLAGVVQDHLGHAIPLAKVELLATNVSSPTGRKRKRLRADHRGAFRHYAEPGTNMSAVAKHFAATSKPASVVVGNHDYRLRLDMSSHARVRVVRESEPILAFSCEQRVRLFGTQQPPRLPVHANGTAWLPKPIKGRPLFLTWSKGGQFFEQPLGLETLGEGTTTLNVASMQATPLGIASIKGLADWPRHSVQIHLLEPLEILPQGGRSASFMEFSTPRFLGVPRGKYRLTVDHILSTSRTTVLHTEIDLGGEDQVIDVAGLVRRANSSK